MIPTEKLKELAKNFDVSNPRCSEYSIDFIWLSVSRQTGQVLSAQELRVFLSALTGYPIELATCEKAMANAPDWIKNQMNESQQTTEAPK